ncbi:uncharacterized protein LOC113019567 isoform X2 [Astatotilapia calliptera]|uniref:uncharacterized protein LOC113019567 isoform X2 n=1 Tax=Astatotilapia calliptera TaxID=8154 RepID=UPI000E40164E|nr:uncharacterized protein LOC113019567 isoform X2 [Astatotilapia calliptera]
MACASQSALDYVRSARDHLVRTLKGFTEIVENLSTRGFFSEEDVNKIKSESDGFDKTRRIVDYVIEMGEEACYEFLRIIDTTRRTSGERSLSFAEYPESSSSLSNMFDLNYWISCFSFREDTNMDVQGPSPCHRYQQKLKSEAQKISERSWTQSKAVLFNKQSSLSYTSLVLDTPGQASPSKIKKSKIKKSRKLRPKKLKTYIPEDKHGTSPSELLKTYERKIILVGKPGTGKTAVVHQMLKLWSEKDNKDLDYMFYFDMREAPNITEVHKLEDLLFSVFCEPDEGNDEVLEDIKDNADSVTIIFDGVTDVGSTSVVFKLIQKTLLPEAKIIITCRPEVESADFLLDWDCLRVEVKGFSEQGIREYLSKNLSENHLNKVLCNLELFSLCHVPMYALMVVACFSFEGSDFSPHPCTVTEIYLNILHFCNQRNVSKTPENESTKWDAILSLSQAAFCATEGKNVSLTSLPKLDSCANLAILSRNVIQISPTVKKPLCAFLHYTVQEFFAALWVLKDPEKTRCVLQQCLVQGSKHMKHLVPFLCGLLNEKNTDLLEGLLPPQQLRDTSGWFFKHLVTTFVGCSDSEDCEVDLMFLCQCLYESQSPDACLCLLDKLDYCIDASGETLDPQQCCVLAYVISQSKERKIELNLEDTTVSKQGMRPLLGCLSKLQRSDSLSRQLWTISLLTDGDVDYVSLLDFTENQLHLPVNSETQLYDRAVRVLQKRKRKVKVCLHCDHRVCQSASSFLLHHLPHIHSLSFCQSSGNLSDQTELLMNLFIVAADREQRTGEKILNMLSSVCSYQTFPLHSHYNDKYQSDFLLDLCSHVKDYETKTGLSVLPSLQPVFQSAPAVWSIDLSERKTSILLELLKLQPEKKQVELRGCSHEESEVRSLLQCLPFISQLSLFCAAAEREQQTAEKILELLASVCTYKNSPLKEKWCDFLLDLYSYETETGLSVLPSLQPVFQSAPAVWSIDLSERKTSILLELLKLQPEKKQVELTGCSHEESEVRSLLQCLPFISQLSVDAETSDEDRTRIFVSLFCAAAEREQQTGEKILEPLASVCTYKNSPLKQKWCDFLLDLYSYETETGLSVLPSLQPVFQSAPAVWSIDLSERKTSILLELLKLQPEKKQVELTGCSHEESEVRSLLQCLPFISQLSVLPLKSRLYEAVRIFVSLFCAAAEREQQTGEKILELLASVCTYQTFPLHERHMEKHYQSDFLLDLCSHVKDCETKTGLSVLPSLQPVFQSAPAVWSIKLSERKTSILLELLKLQPEKKQVELRGCSHEESEVRSLLQCLPFISQLSLFCAAAEREQQTGEKILELLASVCTYQTFPLHERHMDEDDLKRDQRDFLLDLYSHVKDYETKTGLSVLPSLQPVFQSAPAVWSIDLSERKTSILLELLKLQPEKKQVELRGCSHEESEVRSLLQCLPFISQLSVDVWNRHEAVRIFVSLFCAAAEREQQTGEKILELLASVCTYQTFPLHERRMDEDDDDDYLKQYQSDFLLDLCSHVKDCETKTGLSVLPSLQPVFQSAPAVWSIDLSERKTSILLELLKLQPEKKQVELTGCSHEESEVRRLLQCLPFISQLSLDVLNRHEAVRIFVSLFCAAAEREQQTGEKILELLASVCTYQTFPLHESYFYDDDDQINFLLDLCSHVKDCETKTGLSVLPSLQPVFQSAPAVWSIDLSERKTSILLELLKLQPEKKQVELRGCSHEESEVRSLLQCLPFISQLSVDVWNRHEAVMFFVSLFCAAAEREQQTGEKILELLASVCTYQTFPLHERYMDDDDDDLKQYQSDFLLDLCSHVKDCETKTGVSVLPSLQPVFQSAPAVWSINLSERKTSILLELLKLQPEKKQVELRGCSHEESEVRSLLQCLPFISQLRVDAETSDEDRTRIFVSLFCAAAEREQQTGEKILEPLASVCTYKNSPLKQKWCDFLLDLYSYETETGLSVLPSLQPVFQSAPAVWSIDLSERKTSILLELLKLQPEKKQVELIGGSHEESEVRSLLQCLPFISQLSVLPLRSLHEAVRFFVSLFCAAAEREQQTGEKILELLASVCTYQTFPLHERYFYDDLKQYQRDFLLDLYSHVKDCETKTGLSVLPSLQSVFQSAPAVWSINLSERKTSILLELLKLQPEKKQVELRGCSHEESEVRSLLQCLPFISQLSCDPEFFQSVCTSMSVRSREEAQQLESLLQLLGFQLLLTGALHRKSCWSVGRVLKLCGSKVDLILTPSKMSARGGALLFRHTTQLHSLRLSIDMSLLLSQWVRRGRAARRLAVEELSLVPKKARPSHRVLLRAVSSLASLLRYWTVGRLDLTETCIPAQGLIALLLHHGPLTVKLSEESFQQLLSLLHETQDKDLTLSFLSKVGGDLTSCCLSWELLHYLLQQPSAQTITVDLRKNLFLQEETTRLLPFLDRIVFKRPSPSFVMSSIRELYRAHDSHAVPSLLRSLGHVISLSCRQLDSVDCAALIFILRHGDGVRLNLLWTSIPAGGVESILLMLDSVSRLSVDRNQLLRFIHCCAACDVQQEAASGLLRTLQHSLDLSCSSCVELPEEDQTEPLSLTADDCRAVSTILTQGSRDTQLDLRDCEVEDSVLDLLFPVLHRVRLRVSNTVLLQLLSLVPVNSERDAVRRAVSLCTALGGELDLSHSTLDQRVCGALVQMLDSCEGLTELDLSHCQLTDQLLLPLITHLHKVQVLDLSHNQITDASTDVLLQLLSINPSIHCVRLFSNNIVHRAAFKEHTQFEIW